jgi:hypothetical protein
MYDAALDSRSEEIKKNIARAMPANLVLQGYKCYSSLEEDGIIEAIFKIINPSQKTFFEIGCGMGLENNSHFLLLNNWKGIWVDGNINFIISITSALGGDTFKNLLVKNCFVTKDNVTPLFQQVYTHFGTTEIDFLSLDIDGNDYHIMEIIFNTGVQPKAVCVEYNAKWGVYSTVKVKYNPEFVWAGDDYMGVSLGAWMQLFTTNNYTLLCCDIAGNNAFFVHNSYAKLFTLYDIRELYQPARYYLTKKRSGHKNTLKMLKDVVTGQQ